MFGNWFKIDSFEPQPGESPLPGEENEAVDALLAARHEREVARNTFMNRFECEPHSSPYDADLCRTRCLVSVAAAPDFGLGAKNYYESKSPAREGEFVYGASRFAVKNSQATGAVRDISDVRRPGADVTVASGHAIAAFQGGLVVYSSRRPESADRVDLNGHIVPVGDLSGLEGDIVIVQSWDQKASGVRYHLYSGLDSASVVAGDRIQTGHQIGRGDFETIRYQVRRNSVQGPAVEMEVKERRP